VEFADLGTGRKWRAKRPVADRVVQRGTMTRRNRIFLAKAVVVLAVPAIIWAYAEGPPPGLSGVPAEFGTCTYCHSPGGGGSGSVKVAFPNGLTYTSGSAQHLVVTVADPVQQRWGFQLTVRQANDSTAQAGSFNPGSDGFTQAVCSDKAFQSAALGPCTSSMPLEYIEHTWNGTSGRATGIREL